MSGARHYVVHGKVQGVGFRFYALTCAEALGLKGWIRNTSRRTVEAFAEGPESQLDEFAFDLRRGPRYGRVSQVEEEPASPEGHEGFEIVHMRGGRS